VSCPLPSEFAALVPADVANPTCEEIRAILENWSNLVADWVSCRYNEDGTLTESYATELCDVNCGGGGSSGSSTTSS